LAQFGGRPEVNVNQLWNADVPHASIQPQSRGITRGTYRGNNTFYDIIIPGSALHSGLNTLGISVTSGQKGEGYLSPAFVYDSIELFSNQKVQ
ncbi:polysaccharide lyase family protein, partial [Pantoea ananatis]